MKQYYLIVPNKKKSSLINYVNISAKNVMLVYVSNFNNTNIKKISNKNGNLLKLMPVFLFS